MREGQFIKRNKARWDSYQQETEDPDEMAKRFTYLVDDLAYAKTNYPFSKIVKYINGLAATIYLSIYRNKKEKSNRLARFFKTELPLILYSNRRVLLFAFLFFVTFMAIGIFCSVGTLWMLFNNGLMVGVFEQMFFAHDLGPESILVVFIHGTLELSSIVIAGGAGMIMGNAILFPKTYSRIESLKRGAKDGIKIIISLVPIFIVAAFFEGYVTRHTEMPLIMSIGILLLSLSFIVWYFVLYPRMVYQRVHSQEAAFQEKQ